MVDVGGRAVPFKKAAETKGRLVEIRRDWPEWNSYFSPMDPKIKMAN